MATEWGPVADWVGASVTFLGFVGAIAALRVQRKSVDVQLEQHNEAKLVKERAERSRREAAAAEALKKKEKDARAVKITTSAERPKDPPGSRYAYKPRFSLKCRLEFPLGTEYTDVEFRHPDKPSGFYVAQDTIPAPNFSVGGRGGNRFLWEAQGDYWPHGSETEAPTWVAKRTSVTFTDAAGARWLLDGTGTLAEVKRD
ncbi:hypothetical protein LRQ04_16280 [Paenarthrobacter sp. AR 02]|uniref:hypothetical protein n=1 Tax=Paenarthrobacter sp. AR 02 TaxID=2899821 RepID=UPI001F3B59CA|nr:hypothetical protein [Paenarthrobacter sp. AR 02]MCF3140814.1 hypothetical protein [Paenarthrobacter sp. AR 02]